MGAAYVRRQTNPDQALGRRWPRSHSRVCGLHFRYRRQKRLSSRQTDAAIANCIEPNTEAFCEDRNQTRTAKECLTAREKGSFPPRHRWVLMFVPLGARPRVD